MKSLLLTLCLLSLAFMPPAPRHRVKRVEIVQGAGARDLIRPAARTVKLTATSSPRYWVLPFRYGDTNSYWWNVETATNPNGPWTVLITNANESMVTNDTIFIPMNKAESARFWRMAGRTEE